MTSPYAGLSPRAFWRTAVSEAAPLDPGDLYRPKFLIDRNTRIATAGSCFAQHVGRALRENGFRVLDAERLPPAVPDLAAQRFGYRLFSARYANIYTARQLAQLYDEAESHVQPALPVWRKDGRFYDAQRPGVEPDGLDSDELVRIHRAKHLARVLHAFHRADLFVFTFGLTEAWVHQRSGTVYPTAPGTIAGAFDPDTFAFHNFDAAETLSDFERFRERLRIANPGVRFLVTVSPVPLTATASGAHVEVATCYSKSVLRAVCGMLEARYDDVDYFPSYELITAQKARGAYYESNQRNVSSIGVAAAMRLFLRAHGVIEEKTTTDPSSARRRHGTRPSARPSDGQEEACEEALLEAFAR